MDDSDQVTRRLGTSFLIPLAAFIIIVAGMKAAAAILVPFFVAVILAVISAPVVFWLRDKGIPPVLSVLVVVFILIGVMTLIGFSVGNSLHAFLNNLPSYQESLRQEIREFVDWLNRKGIRMADDTILDYLNPGRVMSLVGGILTSLGGLVTNALLILLTSIFLLLELSSFPDKFRRAFQDPDKTFSHFEEFAGKLKDYAAIKTMISITTGVLVGIWVAIWGVDFPVIWGLLAFLLNYIPNFGSIFAAIPAVLLGLIQHDLTTAGILALGYLIINIVVGSVIEPRFMGAGLGLSTLVVFVSLVTWTWILGPVGMLLAVPLTITLKIALQSGEQTRWIAILLGPSRPPSPPSQEEVKAPQEEK